MESTRKGVRPGRRGLSQRIASIPPSGIRRFFDITAEVGNVISLSVGEPDFVTPEHIRTAALHAIEQGETHYTSNYGLLELREAIADNLERRYGLRYDPRREILITTGVSEGLNIAFHALLDDGDEVLMPEPYYVAYPPNVTLAGGVVVTVPTYDEYEFRVQVPDLAAALSSRTKALMLGYPSNPTGSVLTREDAYAIARFVDDNDLFVVADEIYDRLTYGVEHISFPTMPGMQERTILLGGFSKAYAMTGWRLGWTAAPADLLEGMMKVHQYVMMSAPTVAQYAALEAQRSGEEDVRGMVAEYDDRRRLMVEGFNRLGLYCFEPRGAFYCFPDIRSTGLDDETFCERLLREERVAVVPGSAFGASGSGHVRVCYATSRATIEEALLRIGRFVARQTNGAH